MKPLIEHKPAHPSLDLCAVFLIYLHYAACYLKWGHLREKALCRLAECVCSIISNERKDAISGLLSFTVKNTRLTDRALQSLILFYDKHLPLFSKLVLISYSKSESLVDKKTKEKGSAHCNHCSLQLYQTDKCSVTHPLSGHTPGQTHSRRYEAGVAREWVETCVLPAATGNSFTTYCML